VQVACTINYGRKPLWKKQQKLSEAKISFVSLGVLGGKKFLKPAGALTIQPQSARINKVIRTQTVVSFKVGLWRSWERASMAWKRSSVRSRPGPPSLQHFVPISLVVSTAIGQLSSGVKFTFI
jgi:hypothetical protein